MAKIYLFVFSIFVLLGDNFAQTKSFGYKISGNGDIISDLFLIQKDFVLDSVFSNTLKKTFRFEYDSNGRLKRDINFNTVRMYDSTRGFMIDVAGFRDYLYNEKGDVDSVIFGIWESGQITGGYRVSYTYNSAGNILTKLYSSSGYVYHLEENNYDSKGNLIFNKSVLAAYNDTTVSIREYDDQDRLIKKINKENPHNFDQVIYQYDTSGNIHCTTQSIQIYDPDTLISNSLYYFLEFDQSGKLVYQIKSRIFNPADSTWEWPLEIFCDYDENGKMLRMGEPARFHYNEDGNLDTLVNSHPASSGYLENKGRLLDSYGNSITLPDLSGSIIFYYTSFSTVGGISSSPVVYDILQNYPNPFNPITSITFSLPKNDFVTLKVFNILGKEVTTLIDHEKQSGIYTIDWDASDFPSGVYFYRISTKEYSKTKKMLLIK